MSSPHNKPIKTLAAKSRDAKLGEIRLSRLQGIERNPSQDGCGCDGHPKGGPPLTQGESTASGFFHNKWVLCVLSAGLGLDYQDRVVINFRVSRCCEKIWRWPTSNGSYCDSFLVDVCVAFPGGRLSWRSFLKAHGIDRKHRPAGLMTIMCGFARSPWRLIATRIGLAAAQVCYMPTAQAFITDFHGKETQGKAIGIFQAGCYVGIFFAGLRRRTSQPAWTGA